jgi:hypothetical protein
VKLEDEIKRLYGLPLDEFVQARDELAKAARKDGDREAAEQIKALRKPTAGAWALNQAVRRRRKETDALLAAGERLRAAHEELLSGGDRGALREAMDEERALVSSLAECAEAIASETGKSGPQLRDRVRATLHAAALDEETREELAAGRLVREREAAALGPLDVVESGPAGPRPRRAGAASPARGDTAERRRTRRAPAPPDTAAERERAKGLSAASRALQDARFRLEAALTGHERAAERVGAAKDALSEAEEAERAARKETRDAKRELARRERELERLRQKSR